MARPSWTNISDSVLELDDAGTTDLFTALRDNAAAVRIQPFGVALTEGSTASSTYSEHTYALTTIWLPDVADYTGIQRLVSATIQGKVTAGVGSFRLKDDDSGDTGTETTTSSTGYTDLTLTLNLDGSYKGSSRTILVEFKTTAGTVYAYTAPRFDAYLEY